MDICIYIYIYIERERERERWEVLLGIRLLGTTFRRGSSNHQAATAQSSGGKNYRSVPTPLRSTSPTHHSLRLEPGQHSRVE